VKLLGNGPVLFELDVSKKGTHVFVPRWQVDQHTPAREVVEDLVAHVGVLPPAEVDLGGLATAIGGAVAEYFGRVSTDRWPTRAQATERLQKIAGPARRLSDALPERGTQDYWDLVSNIGSAAPVEDEAERRYRQEHAEEVLDAAKKLAGWLEDALADPPLTRFKDDGETPEYWFFGSGLAEVYEAFFKRERGLSRPEGGGSPVGPYVRFALGTADEAGVRKREGSRYSAEIVATALTFYRKRVIGEDG
jgi:hypothetical protein